MVRACGSPKNRHAMIPRRAFVVLATFLLSFLLYVDRVCISTAKGPIVAELQLSDAQFGWVPSAFAFGYALLQTSTVEKPLMSADGR